MSEFPFRSLYLSKAGACTGNMLIRGNLTFSEVLFLFIITSLLAVTVSKISRAFLVPKQLRHLPRVSILKLLLSYARGEPDDFRAQKLLMPFSEQGHGLVLVWALGRWIVHVLSHDLASDLFTDIDRFPKELPPDGLLLWHLIGTSNVVTANGKQWKQQSAIIRGGLNAGIPIDTFVALSEKVTAILHRSIKEPVDFSDIAQRYAIEAVSSAVIGHEFNCLDQESEFVTAYNGIMKEIASPIYLVLPWLEKIVPRHYLRNRIDQFLGRVSLLLKDKKDHPGKDMMTAMINSSEMTPEIQRNNVVTSLIAGHETSAGSLASLAYFLAAHPEIQNKVREEARNFFSSSEDITADRLKKVPYLDACIKEALRINTPASFVVPRLTTASAMLGNYFIPEKTSITANLYAIHHDSRLHRDPHSFDPDRFMLESDGKAKSSWLPFSCGPRQCPARTFALFEQRVLMLTLLKNFHWRLPSTSRHSSGIMNALSPFAVTIPEDMYLQFEPLSEKLIRDPSVTKTAGLELVLGEITSTIIIDSKKARAGDVNLSKIRDVVRKEGALNGWLVFADLLPHHGIHRQLVTDVLQCASTYKRIRSRPAPEGTAGISMTVTWEREDLGLFELGPKGLGGKGWQSNIGYLNLITTWSGKGFAPLGPCTLFIWLGLQKKIIAPENADDCAALQMLSTVDYDFDKLEVNHGGFHHALNIAREAVKSDDNAVRGACLASMISFDLQREVRKSQQEWCISKNGARNFGPADISPSDWVKPPWLTAQAYAPSATREHQNIVKAELACSSQ
ncbi:Cytochrome P450 4c21 [Penicillium rolfsii]|nr:Cytochrome P450 4c21 [Penicillium rolfsii]